MRFSLQITPGLNGHDSSISISTQIALIGLITSLSCLVFGAYRTQSIGHDNSVSLSVQTALVRSIMSLSCQFSSHTTPNPIGYDNSVSFLAQISPVGPVTSLSSLVPVTNCTQSYGSRYFSFDLGLDRTCKIVHVIVLSDFCHKLLPILSVTIVHFRFQHRWHLYDRSHHCLILFLSQIAPV